MSAKRTKKQLYFAHPISFNDTLLERVIITALTCLGYEVVNPGAAEHQRAFQDYQTRYPENDVMEYWLTLVEKCDVCAFTTFPFALRSENMSPSNRRRVSAGVHKEVSLMFRLGRPVFWVSPEVCRVEDVNPERIYSWRRFKILSVEQTVELLEASKKSQSP